MTETLTRVPRPTDAEKLDLWRQYRAGSPTRVPMVLWTNPRVVLLNPDWNPDGITFRQVMEDPETHVHISLRHQLYRKRVIAPHTDEPTALPDVWTANLMIYNVYEAAMLGAPVHLYDDQVPDTEPYLDEDNKHAIFELDIEHPMDWPFIRKWLAFWRQMEKVCDGLRFEGRPVKLAPWTELGTDGPVTVGMNLRGAEFMLDLAGDPDYAARLMNWIITAAIFRRRAFVGYWGKRVNPGPGSGMADDSCALLSHEMYERIVLPVHRRWYGAGRQGGTRMMHMCGDATRLFPLLKDKLAVNAFDTGFPVDHGALRRTLGPDVEIQGGPAVALLLNGTPEAVYAESKRILTSGVKAGGRFVFREGNNLPPNVPEPNLAAMYDACLQHGRID